MEEVKIQAAHPEASEEEVIFKPANFAAVAPSEASAPHHFEEADASAPSEAVEETESTDASAAQTSSAGNILPLDKLKNGWNVFSQYAAKVHEQHIKPAAAAAAEKASAFHETQLKPALATAAEKTNKFHQETIKPAWDKTVESATPYVESAKEKAAAAWEVTKEKTAEVYVKAKPTLDSASEQASAGVNKLVAMVSGKPAASATGAAESSTFAHDDAPSALDSSTKGSFTI